MTTTAMKRKSISGGECPFGAKKVKTEKAPNGVAEPREKKNKKEKKTLPEQNGTVEKQKVGGKKTNDKRDVANEAENGSKVNDFDGVPVGKVAENFRQKLSKGSVAVDAIRHFTQAIQENQSLAVDFIRAGGTFKPLLKILDSMDKEKLADIAKLLELIHYILIESVNFDEVHADYANKCARKIFTDYKSVVMSLLKGQQDEQLVMAGFRILKAIMLVDQSHGRDILLLLDVCLPEMEVAKYRETSSSDNQESLRGVFVDFNLAFLIDTRSELVRLWLSRYQLVSPLVSNLVYDRAENVVLVMKTFQQYILESRDIDKYVYRTTFSTDVLKALVNVYEWVGPTKQEISVQMKNTVLNAAEKVILPLLTSKKHHLVPKVVDLGRGNSRHKHILLALKNSQLHKHQRKLVLKMFEACPEVLPAVLENFGTLLKKKNPEMREFLLEILRQPVPEEITKNFTLANAKQVSNYVTKSTLPRTVLEFVTTSINKKFCTGFCLEFLSVMLSQCEKYLQEIPKLKNLDQFDLKKVKFDVINQIIALFPTIDAIMAAMMYHRSDRTVEKPYIAMEHAMDILLACIRTFPSYIESSSFITTYRNILDPVYRHRVIEFEYLSYEFKAIQVIIALEPQSIAFNSELFPSVLKLLTKVYLNGTPEMQRQATTQLLALFQNTTLFGNNPTEIEIWFQSLLYVDPLIVPELVSFLAFSCRQAAERQSRPIEKDHSVINEAFEKVRQSDLEGIFERVEVEAAGQLEQEETVELPVADNFLIYMFNPSTIKPPQFHAYLEAVALRYFHFLPHPEIVENCTKNMMSELTKYFRNWIVKGKIASLDTFEETSSLGRLSNLLLLRKKNLDEVLPEGPRHRCELVYLIHETIFYATRLIELDQFNSSYASVFAFYLNGFLDKLIAEEADLALKDQKLGGVLENIFCHRPVLYQHFTIASQRSETSTVVTNFIYDLMKRLQSAANFSHYTMLYSNKIVNEIILSSTPKITFELDATLVERLLEIFELNEKHCVTLLKHYSHLSHRKFINDKNEKTYHYHLLTIGLQKLASNRDHFLERETISAISKIYVDFIRENGNELNLESFEVALQNYLDTFSHSIGHLEVDLFRCFFESKRIGKPMVKLAAFLLGRDIRLYRVFLDLVQENVSKKELIYPLTNVAFAKGVFAENSEKNKKILNVIYNEFKSGISKTIEKPGKAAVIYKENTVANHQLIKNCMPSNECVDFAKKKLKIDSMELYQLKLMMEIYRKAFKSTKKDEMKIVYVNVFNVLFQFYNIILKVEDLLKEIDKLNGLVLETFSWIQMGRTCKHLTNLEFKDITATANWTNFCKFALKLGIDIQKSPDNPNRQDERLHVLLKITAVLVDLFYKDNSQPADVATFFELALSHSRFLDVLLIPFQFKIKTSLVHLLLILARKNPSVMDKKHVPLLLGAYGATLTDGNRYVLALLQWYERSGIHMHEYRPYLWGDAAIKHFSLGQDVAEQQTLFRINNFEVFRLFNKEKLFNTLNSFPVWRKLDAVAQLPGVNFDDIKPDCNKISEYQTTTEIERFVERKLYKKKLPSPGLLHYCAGKQDVLATIYDPAFLLPILGYLFAPESHDLLDVAGKNGALALPFVCLASEDEEMRLAAASVILRIKGHLELSRKFIDSKFWLHLFNAVQNGLATLNSRKRTNADKSNADTKKFLSKPAFLPALFIGKTINIIPDALNELHPTLTQYFLLKDTFDFKAVPHFLVMFHSSEVKHNDHRVFILESIYNGIKTNDDFMVLRFSPVIRAIMDFYDSSLSNRELNILILNTLNSIVKIPKSCEVMINSMGFLTWLSERIEGIESFHFDTIEAFLGIISNLWYSALIQRKGFNLMQLSRSVLIMVLKFLPLLSTRSSSKTLTRFLNLLEKTTLENEQTLELVNGEVLELMMAYFEKLFEQHFWYVKYVKMHGMVDDEDYQLLGEKLQMQGADQSTIYVTLTLRRLIVRKQRLTKK
ncbi:uncharacterized protein LOC5572221 [Aedes aegypti]|uniref:Nucleolar pre-ribosomal-associated protein 1 n=1 Tax=Aedes aegypti TaxID=7159 RepID=A0A903UJC3_AEDAE|nr:uncharacterized protein LOC5572221 [Aedes aegypti]